MTPTRIAASTVTASRRLFGTSSLTVLALAMSFAAHKPAKADVPFQSMIAMQAGQVKLPDGTMSQWTGADRPVVGTATDGRPLMTIKQTQQKALLDWEKFRLATGEVLDFQQQSADWIAVNRVHGADASQIDGEIRAKGRVFIFNDNGVLMGAGATVSVRQLVTGSGVNDVDVAGNITTITQFKSRAILNWSDLSSQTGEALRFVQAKKDWSILNRSLAAGTTKIAGNVQADGEILLVARNGLSIDGAITAQQAVLSSLDIRDTQFLNLGLISQPEPNNRLNPTFSNTWNFKGLFGGSAPDDLLAARPPIDANDPLAYNVTIGKTGSVTTGTFGKVMLFGPGVNNKGTISVKDEGQVLFAAGDNIYLTADNKNVSAFVGAYNPISAGRYAIGVVGPYSVSNESWQRFWREAYGREYEIGSFVPDGAAKVLEYLAKLQNDRAVASGFHARNEGIITAARGGRIDFRGLNLEQMGVIDMTSTALFRSSISFFTAAYDRFDYGENQENGPSIRGNGDVVFGKNSLTQITPDLDATDKIAVSSGAQSVGSIKINAARVDVQENAMIHMPSGTLTVLLDQADFIYDNNRGAGANQDNESGTRFLMRAGATIDLSGWKDIVLPMGYHQVTGKLFAAQLADAPLQRDGALYRKEITVDRRYGTDVANWQSFDNLSQGTLAQFLINGGTFKLDTDNDFIMTAGSVIDVSGGVTTYTAGYVNTTLLRTLDNRIVDIREADPDTLYMGLANEYVTYDPKWGKQKTSYIPFMSSTIGRYEDGYVHGGAGGLVDIIAPDVVLQGTMKGGATIGKYQRANAPKGGTFTLNGPGDTEYEYVSNNILIQAHEKLIKANFGIDDQLGALFGDEYDQKTKTRPAQSRTFDNTTLASADFFNRSSMGSYSLVSRNRTDLTLPGFPAISGVSALVEAGADIKLVSGGSLTLYSDGGMQFLGNVRTEGGDVNLQGAFLTLGATTVIDTHGGWTNDFEIDKTVPLTGAVRINGGAISLTSVKGLIVPDGVKIEASGGGWVDRSGVLKGGVGGDLIASMNPGPDDEMDLSGLAHARAFGLGGNGHYAFGTGQAVLIANGLPELAEGEIAPYLLSPDFFAGSGFSSISIGAPSISIGKDALVDASSALLVVNQQDLIGTTASYLTKPTGTDIFDVAHIEQTPLALRPAALRHGMDISLQGLVTMEVGSRLSTQAGGKITLTGSADIAGTISAPSGAINIVANPTGTIGLASTAKLLAPGAFLVTDRSLFEGRELVDGVVLPGGTITLNAFAIAIAPGAVLDVSGTSTTFDVLRADGAGGFARVPTLIGSNGGSISISGNNLSIDGGTYLGFAGSPSARGGSFNFSWAAGYGVDAQPGRIPPESAYDLFGIYFSFGIFFDKQGNAVTDFFNTDLSNVDWASVFGVDFVFPPGYSLSSNEELIALLKKSDAAGIGPMPVLYVGDNLNVGPPPKPEVPEIAQGLKDLLGYFGYQFLTPNDAPGAFSQLSTNRIADGGFSALSIASSPAVIFSGDVVVGGKKADGSYKFDRIDVDSTMITATAGSHVRLEAGVVDLSTLGAPFAGALDLVAYKNALGSLGILPVNPDTTLTIDAKTLLQIQDADFFGFSDTRLFSGGDIRLSGSTLNGGRPSGNLYSTGKITLKADQIYATSGAAYRIESASLIDILPQDAGNAISGTPYEGGAALTITAPEIRQGGTLRSPLGTINLTAIKTNDPNSGKLTLLDGSITSVNGDGHVIPYGYLSNGDTWLDPLAAPGIGIVELTKLPIKAINIAGDIVDLQTGALLDVSGGGDFYSREFVPGIGGSNDWLTGYRDTNYDWVNAPGEIFAVLPGFEGDIAPVGLTGNNLGIGDKIYLSGGSGLKAGYYTLLPAEYALLPGAFRVTSKFQYKGNYGDMPLGQSGLNADGSSIQAGYRFTAGSQIRDQRNTGYLVMSGTTLRERSHYEEAYASSFFTSAAFLKKALRINKPIGDPPRTTLDGGSVVIDARTDLHLDASLKSKAAKGGRGGFVDINAAKIAVVGADTDKSQYAGYLLLDSDRLTNLGAESLLLGGVRRQGDVNIEITIGAKSVVVDNAGSILAGPELLFAASNKVEILGDSAIETAGTISGSSGDLRLLPVFGRLVDTKGTPYDFDDVLVHQSLDQGALLRISSGAQVNILRDPDAIGRLNTLTADPAALAAVNAQRVALGFAEIGPAGDLIVADGARLISSRSLALDATGSNTLGTGATLSARQISAASSRVSIGEVPANTPGLVFAGGSLGALATAQDVILKSYSTIDLYGAATLRAANALSLDTREIRLIAGDAKTATIAGKTLTLANSNGGVVSAGATGNASLLLEGETIYFTGGSKRISGVADTSIHATGRIIGQNDGTLYIPGTLNINAASLTADSGARLFFDVAGAVNLNSTGGSASLTPFKTFGATLGITASSIRSSGAIGLTGGTVQLRARDGDILLDAGSSIDVTSDVAEIFDVKVGVGAGQINLISDRGNITLASNAGINVSGTTSGGDAGLFSLTAGLGTVTLSNNVKGSASNGFRSGAFSIVSQTLGDFTGLNAALDMGGFLDARHFEFNQGDAAITGSIKVRDFAMIANGGSIALGGTIETVGENGGRVQLSAARNVDILGTGQIIARATGATGSGGTVLIETVGEGGGRINLSNGSLIDVTGVGEGGRLVRLRAPQIGNDLGIDRVDGTIIGARTVIAEGFRVYDGVSVIDTNVINLVSGDAAAFMTNAAAISARLGSGVTVQPGIELRSSGDMTLANDWDLHNLRFDGAAGVLTLRAQGDLKLDANLSDGFSDSTAAGALQTGPTWTFNLTAGANITSPNSLGVLPQGQLADGKGSIIVGGTPDTIEYFYDPAYNNENRLYLRDGNGDLARGPSGLIELTRDANGKYIDPATGAPIEQDPTTGDYVDTPGYARRPLPYFFFDEGGYDYTQADGTPYDFYVLYYNSVSTLRSYLQYDNSTGYLVRTGTSGINMSSGRDLVLKYRPSVVYTAGQASPDLAGFYAPAGVLYPIDGGDISINVARNIIGSDSIQLPSAWLVRRVSTDPSGLFSPGADRAFDQSTWYVDFSHYQAGIGALGGGNIDISAGGDILNLSVNIPTTGRVSGNTAPDEPAILTTTGGGDLTMRAAGNIGSGKFLVDAGLGTITAGGGFITSSKVGVQNFDHFNGAYVDYGLATLANFRYYDMYALLFTSTGQFKLQAGGDINIDAVLDPLLSDPGTGVGFVGYRPSASVDLFSAGGNITIWNNSYNISMLGSLGHYLNPTFVTGTSTRPGTGFTDTSYQLWPGDVSAVAASGNITVLGGLLMAPSPTGSLDLIAGGSVTIGYDKDFLQLNGEFQEAFRQRNYRTSTKFDDQIVFPGIFMSQAKLELFRTATNPHYIQYGSNAFYPHYFRFAGPGASYNINGGSVTLFSEDFLPDLHVGDLTPARIYAGTGNIVTSAQINLPKALRVQSGGNIYFPQYIVQHNNPSDLSVVRAGKGLYIDAGTLAYVADVDSQISIAGPGRLLVETGGDIYIARNDYGITTRSLAFGNGELVNPDQKAADISVAVGYNQQPDYAKFDAAYLQGSSLADYLTKDAGDGKQLSIYLFDRLYSRGDREPDSQFFTPELRAGFVNYIRERQGLAALTTDTEKADYLPTAWDYWTKLPVTEATPYDAYFPKGAAAAAAKPEFYLPETRPGLVNFVRNLQGLAPLATQDEQLAYLDIALAAWNALTPDSKAPLYQEILNAELRTTGREANAAANPRYNSSTRGYDAIAILYPGAQKRADEALVAGESRWAGDFETFASRVMSFGGGNISFLIPGGALKLANVAAPPDATGQPPSNNGRGNALAAGIVTVSGGEVNIFAHDNVTVNESRILTAKGGNMVIWSSFGDIAAGKGAKTSLSPTFYDYTIDPLLLTNRTPAGLPSGAGIGTVASVDGAPAADVDLIAPNGIVDAGDAGIRVSGNFNVFAVQILGTDNIDISGIAIGLPTPPAAPLGIIAPTEGDAQSRNAAAMVTDQISKVKRDAGLKAPSIIEVRVTGFGEECTPPDSPKCAISSAPTGRSTGTPISAAEPVKEPIRLSSREIFYNIPPQPVRDTVRAIVKESGVDLLYDASALGESAAPRISGKMTAETAMRKAVKDVGLQVQRTGENSIVLSRANDKRQGRQ